MPRPDQIATVTADGQKYDIWTALECTRSTEDVIDHALLTVAEISPRTAAAINSLKLKPGDQATVALAGQKIISGLVFSRQSVVDGRNHQVQIGISSMAQSVIASTVDGEPWTVCQSDAAADRLSCVRQGRRQLHGEGGR